jgi:hypothetical protein
MHQWKVGELALYLGGMTEWPHFVVGHIYPVKSVDPHSVHFVTKKNLGGGLLFETMPDPLDLGLRFRMWGARFFRPLDESDYKHIREKHKLQESVK